MTEKDAPSVAEHLWTAVAQLGVRTVFGLPGTTNLAALDALRRRGSPFVVARHEQGAGHMADASARMGAPFGVTLVDLGPGLANSTTAMLAAQRDSVPLLVVAGNEAQWLIGREVWHEMPELETYRGLAKLALRLERGSDFPRMLRRAVSTMLGGRPGPVLLSIPKNLWDAPAGPESAAAPALPRPPRPATEAVEEAARMLAEATRPLLLLGGGAKRSDLEGVSIPALVETLGLPVVTSPNGRGALPEDHPLCLGHAGRFGQRQASHTLAEADVVAVLGCQLNDLVTHNWSLLSRHQRYIQVDHDAATLGRGWPLALGLVGDPVAFLDALAAQPMAGRRHWELGERVAERQRERAEYYAISDSSVVKPQAVMRWLERLLPPEHCILMGGGRFQQFVGEWLVRDPRSFFYAANSGTVGYALPAAIGAALQSPERQVVCCLGDGDFMMNVQEVETAVRTASRIKVVVLNDFAYGAMRARQEVPFGTEYDNPSIEDLARAFGAAGRTLTRGSDVEGAVRWLLEQPGVAVLDVHIDLDEDRSLMFGHDIGRKANS